jgi:hypothetical protein
MMTEGKITQAELTEIFGDTMPIAAVIYLERTPTNATADMVRATLRQMAKDRDAAPHYITNDIAATIGRLMETRHVLTFDAQQALTALADKPVETLTPIECLWLGTLIAEHAHVQHKNALASLFNQLATAVSTAP